MYFTYNKRRFTKTNFSLCFVLFFLSGSVVAQVKTNLDSLKQLLKTDISEKGKIDVYNKMAEGYRRTDSAKTIYYTSLALKQARKNNYTKGISEAYNCLAWLNLTKSNFERAEYFFKQNLASSQKGGYKKGIAMGYQGLGILAYHIKAEYLQALSFYQKAMKIAEQIESLKLKGSSYNGISLVYGKLNNFVTALEYQQKSLTIQQQIGNKIGESSSYNNIGSIYYNQKNFRQAISYYEKALKIDESVGDKISIAIDNQNIGSAYKELGNYQKAFAHIQRGQLLAKEANSKSQIAFGNRLLGNLELAQKNYSQARKYFLMAYELYNKIGQVSQITIIEISLGEVAYYQKKYQKALDFLNKGITRAREHKQLIFERNGTKTIAKVYEAMGDFKQAYQNYQLFKKYSDSLFNEESTRNLANQEAQFNFNKKEDSLKAVQDRERALFKADKERRKANQRSTYIGLGLLSLLLVVLLYFFWDKQRTNKKLNEANGKLELSNQEITANNEEILTINNSLHDALGLVEKQRDDIISSINYAQRIQKATLPDINQIIQVFPESFILYQPRDIVSGDFYWYAKIEPLPIYSQEDSFGAGKVLEGFTNEKQVLVVADCTGHGVPGGFLTMLATQALINVVSIKGITAPHKILKALDTLFKNLLKTDTSKMRDGMDITIVVIDNEEKTMQFAGAKNSIVLMQKGEMKKVRGDVQSINGHARNDKVRTFTLHTIDITVPTSFYLFSDGYVDQFGGGETPKKFSTRRFMELLHENVSLPMDEQYQVLDNTMKEWMGKEDQIDDILVMGVKLS